jgi:AraC-like DNA-binding protein
VYREIRPPAGLSHVACSWVSDGAAARVLPDACVDVVLVEGRLVVAGPATSAVEVAPTPDHYRCGVRFRVGAAGAALGAPVDLLRDLSVPLEDLWGAEGRRLSARVAGAPSAEQARAMLLRGLLEPRASLDPVARGAAVLSTRHPFHEVSRELGVSERQLRRRVEHAVGYGPRTLVRILRLQRFLQAVEREPITTSLAQLASDAGYADQAHLARECRALSGRTPSALRGGHATAAGERMAETF